MKNVLYILVAVCLMFLASCDRKKIPKSLPVEKVYIMEFNPVPQGWNERQTETVWGISLIGIVELKNNFDLKIMKQKDSQANKYFETEFSLPDSLRSSIYKIIKENQKDTVYMCGASTDDNAISECSTHRSCYQIIIERKFYESTRILFDPYCLPEDMKYLFDQLYVNSLQKKRGDDYQNLINKFQPGAIQSIKKYLDCFVPPPPALKNDNSVYASGHC